MKTRVARTAARSGFVAVQSGFERTRSFPGHAYPASAVTGILALRDGAAAPREVAELRHLRVSQAPVCGHGGNF